MTIETMQDIIREIDLQIKYHKEESNTPAIRSLNYIKDRINNMTFNLIEGLKCLRCSHTWKMRGKRLPYVCPKCKSNYWNRERRSKEGET